MYSLYLKVLKMDETLGTVVSNRLGMGGGFLTLFFGWLTTTNAAILIGIIVTIAGFIMSLYFQRKRHLREVADTALRVELLLKEDARKEELHALKIKEFTES
jgi:fucose permease